MALELAVAADDPWRRAYSESGLAQLASAEGDRAGAVARLERARVLAERLDDPRMTARVLQKEAELALKAGEHDRARQMLLQALEIYRATYRPSTEWPKPHAMVGVNVVAADTDLEAARLFTSIQQRFLGMQRGQRGPLPRPIAPEAMEAMWSPAEKAGVERMLAASATGSPETVRRQLQALISRTQADELIVAGAVHDHAARLRSYELLSSLTA